MAHATAIAIGITWLLAAPALAADDVYVWRDPSGVVRFSSVQEPQTELRPRAEEPRAARDRDQQQLAASEVQK
jgi:hypothetical protein